MSNRRLWLATVRGLLRPSQRCACRAIARARRAGRSRQITMVVCFPAGGGTDIAARLVNTQLGEALGKPVIIENRGGAGGNIAITAVKRLPADGYTLLVCSSAYVVNPSLYAQATYDPLKDFIPLMVIGASPNVFVVPGAIRDQVDEGVHRQGEGQPRQDELDQPRRRHHAAARRRTAQAAHRHRDAAHPVPRRRPRDQRGARRHGRSLHRQHRLGAGPDRRRQGAADRGDREEALAAAAERADAGGDRHQGRRVRHLPGRLCAGRHAAADRRPAGEGTDRDPRPPDIKEKFAKIGLPVVAEGPGAFRKRVEREVPMYKEIIDKAGLRFHNRPTKVQECTCQSRSPESASSSSPTSSPGRCAARCSPTWAPTSSRSSRRRATWAAPRRRSATARA